MLTLLHKINVLIMSTFLFDEIIFGPVKSRRLGVSLGINLLPNNSKFCNFNCIYCECGWTKDKQEKQNFHKTETVISELESKLTEMLENNLVPDVITFAGNGEPTLHPDFGVIIDKTIEIRNRIFPNADIAVLSNATMIHKPKIFNALSKIEQNILKLDSAIPETTKLINGPLGYYNVDSLLDNLQKFNSNFILQTMFLRGAYNDKIVDNTTEKELFAWLYFLSKAKPKQVMIYTIARDTPTDTLEKVPIEELNKIAKLAENAGFKVQVSG